MRQHQLQEEERLRLTLFLAPDVRGRQHHLQEQVRPAFSVVSLFLSIPCLCLVRWNIGAQRDLYRRKLQPDVTRTAVFAQSNGSIGEALLKFISTCAG